MIKTIILASFFKEEKGKTVRSGKLMKHSYNTDNISCAMKRFFAEGPDDMKNYLPVIVEKRKVR